MLLDEVIGAAINYKKIVADTRLFLSRNSRTDTYNSIEYRDTKALT